MKVKWPDNTRFISAVIKCTNGTLNNDRMVIESFENEYLFTVYDGTHVGSIIVSKKDAKALANLLLEDIKNVDEEY